MRAANREAERGTRRGVGFAWHLRSGWLPTAVAVATLCAAPAHAVQIVKVIPPGQEQAIATLLGEGTPLGPCTLADAAIARDHVRARYQCDGTDVVAELRAAGQRGDCGKTEHFAVQASEPLCGLLLARVRQHEAGFRWLDVRAEAPAPPAATEGPTRPEPIPADVLAALRGVERMARDGDADGILAITVPLAQRNRHPLVIGALVVGAAQLAGGPGGKEAVERLLAAAKANPEDAVGRFLAGVAVHYRGHTQGATRAEKSADYQRAITLLEPLRETFASSPRLWIYLAVSYVRTGRQADAEDAIERAAKADGGHDADVWYCRAEVWHRKDPARALGDIDRYIEQMHRNAAQGAWSAPEKERRVSEMRAWMADVAAGRRPPPETPDLFDPVEVRVRESHQVPLEVYLIALFGALIAAGCGVGLGRSPRSR